MLEPESVSASEEATPRAAGAQPSPAVKRFRAAYDAVAGQKDAWASRLFWHTDLEAAKAEARASGKPIVSLSMLGRLDEDCSCANSRFFRTVLYANAEVSKALRERFVLHWRSMRPVPKVTIDFGDGRRIERTITGNSMHVVLDEAGRPVDAIPGLYGPAAFLRALAASEALAKRIAPLDEKDRLVALGRAHGDAIHELDVAWSADLEKVVVVSGSVASAHVVRPAAREASALAASKGHVESPILSSLAGRSRGERPGPPVDDATWAAVAALHAEDARLDASSHALILAKRPDLAREAMRLATSKRFVEDPILRVLRPFERTIAEDTVRNEYGLRRVVRTWFAAGEVGPNLAPFVERVYADVFLTPSSDPWLGLVKGDAYAALEGDGVVVPEAAPAK